MGESHLINQFLKKKKKETQRSLAIQLNQLAKVPFFDSVYN
jgi:hypothetical protein